MARILKKLGIDFAADLPLGAVLGTARLVECVAIESFDARDLLLPVEHTRLEKSGPFGQVWVLEEPRRIEPAICWHGDLNRTVPDDLWENPQYREVRMPETSLIRWGKRGNWVQPDAPQPVEADE